MSHRDVSPDEMRWPRPEPDPIDAVLGDEIADEDLTDVAALVHDLRSAYTPDRPLRRSAGLAGFTQPPLDDKGDLPVTAGSNAHGSAVQTAGLPNLRERLGRTRTKMLSALSGFIATLTGKIALGTAVAAASVGGLHAAHVVEVPLLPDDSAVETDEQVETGEYAEPPETDVADVGDGEESDDFGSRVADDARDGGVDGPQIADEAQGLAGVVAAEDDAEDDAEASDQESEFSLAMQEWSSCVDAASAAHDEATAEIDASETGPPEPFDPEEACGERPTNPAVPDNAGPPEGTPDGPPEATPAGPPEGTPDGPPEGTPHGPPEGTPAGPPEATPDGPPEATPAGPPEATPDGPPEATQADGGDQHDEDLRGPGEAAGPPGPVPPPVSPGDGSSGAPAETPGGRP